MPLTGVPLIALSCVLTAVVVAGMVWVWGRQWRLRVPLRVVGVLLTEALLLLSIGLVVNRQEQFFPSWAALFGTDQTPPPTYHTVAGSMDEQLAALARGHTGNPLSLPWKPDGWTGWRLAGAPTLVVPAGYLQHPEWRYSVVLVIGAAAPGWPGGWSPAAALHTAAGASREVVAYVTTTTGTVAQTLTTDLPDVLRHDLRVTDHRWAVVTSPADAALVRAAVMATPWQYPAVATVGGSSPAPAVKTSVKPAVKTTTKATAKTTKKTTKTTTKKPVKKATKKPAVKPTPTKPSKAVDVVVRAVAGGAGSHRIGALGVPDGITTSAVAGGSATTPAAELTVIAAAVTWAGGQTPPPLASSSAPVKYLPIHRRPKPSGSADPSYGAKRGKANGS